MSKRPLDDGTLLSYLDGALDRSEREHVERYLAESVEGQTRLGRLEAERAEVESAFAALAPTPFEGARQQAAWSRFQHIMTNQGDKTMLQKLTTSRRYQRIATAVAAFLIVAGLFAFAPVRAFASDLLGMFRVESFTVVQFDPARMEELASVMDENMSFGVPEVLQDAGEPVQVASIAEAAAAAGFTPRLPATAGDPTYIAVHNPGQIRYTPNVAEIRTVFEAVGLDPDLMPAEVDGQPFDFTIPAGIMVAYSEGENGPAYELMQAPSPTAEIPDSVDPEQLGEALLLLLGLSPADAASLSQSIDWTSTLVVPLPAGIANATEVEIDGVSGLLIEATDDEIGEAHGLLWQKDGFVYMLNSYGMTAEQTLALAGLLQ